MPVVWRKLYNESSKILANEVAKEIEGWKGIAFTFTSLSKFSMYEANFG